MINYLQTMCLKTTIEIFFFQRQDLESGFCSGFHEVVVILVWVAGQLLSLQNQPMADGAHTTGRLVPLAGYQPQSLSGWLFPSGGLKAGFSQGMKKQGVDHGVLKT